MKLPMNNSLVSNYCQRCHLAKLQVQFYQHFNLRMDVEFNKVIRSKPYYEYVILLRKC